MILLVYVHGYNLKDTYLQAWTMVDEPMTFTAFFEYLMANGLLRFRVPMLFFISGYLYALNDYKPYRVRTLKRLRTLGLPYLLWSFIALLLTFLLEYIPLFRDAIYASYLAMIDNDRHLVLQYAWYEWLIRIFLVPIPFQLWFIRVLLIYNIAYPPLRWCVMKLPAIWFLIAGLLWFVSFYVFFIEGAGLFFFTLGIWVQKRRFDIEKTPSYLSPAYLLIIFIGASFLKTYLAFQGYGFLGGFNTSLMNGLYKLTEISGLLGIWYGADSLVKVCMQRHWFTACIPFSFIIYALHVPILYYVMHLSTHLLSPHWQYHRLITFLFVPLLIIGVSILFGAILRKSSPKVYGILTGGRGLE
jgi:fucose 4-O-acetylase-like acetyltransferase